MSMSEIRLKTRLSEDRLQALVGRVLEDDAYDILLTGPARVLKPTGQTLAVYVPRAIPASLMDASYEVLHELRKFETDNRGPASGVLKAPRVRQRHGLPGEEVPEDEPATGRMRARTRPVASAIIGAIDPAGPKNFCRLTAWTGAEWNKFEGLFPLFKEINGQFERHVPERYAVQQEVVARTKPEWVIRDTVFSTITVNNSYPTGVHKDAGDLEEGFSNVTALRRGNFRGGRLVFPEWRVAVDLQHGDTILMDAHDWHGNTMLYCQRCGDPMERGWHPDCKDGQGEASERISVVAYFRTKVAQCASLDEEHRKGMEFADRGTERGKRLA